MLAELPQDGSHRDSRRPRRTSEPPNRRAAYFGVSRSDSRGLMHEFRNLTLDVRADRTLRSVARGRVFCYEIAGLPSERTKAVKLVLENPAVQRERIWPW